MEAAMEVASNLLPDDYREVVEGHGYDPVEQLAFEAENGSSEYFTIPDGKTAVMGLAGVGDDGCIWMLCTPAIYEHPIAFVKKAKNYVNSRPEPLLWNVVDARNKVHIRLLRFLGFKFLRKISFGPNQLSFIEFCRVRRE